jgi:hypothetical protein
MGGAATLMSPAMFQAGTDYAMYGDVIGAAQTTLPGKKRFAGRPWRLYIHKL